MIRKSLYCSTAYLLASTFAAILWQGGGPFTDIGEDQYRRWVYVDENTLFAERLSKCRYPTRCKRSCATPDNECNVICFDPDGPDLEADFTVFLDSVNEIPHNFVGSARVVINGDA